MSKITLEITEVVNGLTISETPTTLQGDLLAAASTSATAVSFTPAARQLLLQMYRLLLQNWTLRR